MTVWKSHAKCRAFGVDLPCNIYAAIACDT